MLADLQELENGLCLILLQSTEAGSCPNPVLPSQAEFKRTLLLIFGIALHLCTELRLALVGITQRNPMHLVIGE